MSGIFVFLFLIYLFKSTPLLYFIPNGTNVMSLQAQTKARHKVMGVLDIYGFEIFEVRQIAAQTSLFFFFLS